MRELRGRTHGPRRQRVTELACRPGGDALEKEKVEANDLRQVFPLDRRPATGQAGGAQTVTLVDE